jgi:peptidoglycan/LPS O-acetylase OafA/YrhL
MEFKYNRSQQSHDISSIGLLRGIASIMVCFFHLSRGNPRLLPDTSYVKQLGTWGWSGVEVFFIISGFVIPYSLYIKNYTNKNFGVFLKKRIIRIEPPYIFSIALVLVMNYVSTLSKYYRGAPFHIDWLNVASHIAYLNVFTGQKWLIDVYWTLAIEFQYYILIALIFKLIISEKALYRFLFFIPFMILYFQYFLGSAFIFSYAVFFMLGILLFQFFCNIINKKEFLFSLVIVFSLLLYHEGLVLALISLTTLVVISFVKKVPPFFQYLGTISYSLYLVHIPIGGRVINITETLIKNIHLREFMVFVALVVSLVASHLFYILIERRFKRLSGNVKYTNG